MKAEEKNSGYKPSGKAFGQRGGNKEQNNMDFLARLDKEMEADSKNSGYVPYNQRKNVKNDPMQDFMNRVDMEMKKEEKGKKK